MSWTVQEKEAQPHSALEQLLNTVMDEKDTEYVPSPEKKSTSDSMTSPFNPKQQPATSAAQQPAISPAPLTPSDLQVTPVKDPLESFNSWMKNQTPGSGSRGASPTPAANELTPNQSGSVNRPLQFTPQKFNGSAPVPMDAALGGGMPPAQGTGNIPVSPTRESPVSAGSPLGSTPGATPTDPKKMKTIYDQRRALMAQMEDLALQEMELRQSPNSNTEGGQYPDPNEMGVPTSPEGSSAAMSQSSPSMQLTAESIRGRVYETAKDQHGCRFLQRWLDTNYDGEAAQVIMSEIVPHVPELMTDQYANFLVQKLFDIMPHDIRYNVAQVAAPHMTMIALTPHGTFSVQKLIETIATREEMEIVRESLSHDVVHLVKNVHGNHVIQKVLQRFEHPDKQFIYDAVVEDCPVIATNKQGCCVLQRCLEFASAAQRAQLVHSILGCAIPIVQDPFGNYVLQYVLEAHDVPTNDSIARLFLPHILRLSMNKFSSNVMEKVLRGCSISIRDDYVLAMKDTQLLARMIQDDYGNYVVQTALTVSSLNHAEGLVSNIRPLMHLIRNAPYAKKLEAKMDLVLKKKGGMSPLGSGHRQFSPYAKGPEPAHGFGPQSPGSHHSSHQQSPSHGMPQHMDSPHSAHTPQRGGGFPRAFRPNAQPWSPTHGQ